jgi:uncharacterized repeat protein (TIGR01451 family)
MVAALLVLLLGVFPAGAGAGDASGAGVVPVEITYGGGAGACFASFSGTTNGGLPSAASNELHINNPASGIYTGPDGTQVEIIVSGNDRFFEYEFLTPGMAAFDVIVNGGSQNTHFDNDDGPSLGDPASGVGPLTNDSSLHAPTRGGSTRLYRLSHINICYDENPLTDLKVSKVVVGDATPEPGGTVSFKITAENLPASNTTATGVVVNDTLPSGMTIVGNSIVVSEGTFSTATNLWTGLELAPGESQTLEFDVTIDANAGGQELINAATISGDQTDPDPTNDDAESVPPVVVNASITGTKFHDRDTDGLKDPSNEELLGGWTIAAFDGTTFVTSATTGVDGEYALTGLAPNVTYTICEETTTSGLPPGGTGFFFEWQQSVMESGMYPDYTVDACTGDPAFDDYEADGHEFTLTSDTGGIDFGNHTKVVVDCSSGAVEAELGGPDTSLDNPLSVVSFPAGCPSGTFVSTYDVGRSADGDTWEQFVVFGGDPSGSIVLTQTIVWDSQLATHIDANGDPCAAGTVGCHLLVPQTVVRLVPGGAPVDYVFCNSLTDGVPNTTPDGVSDCLDSQTTTEGGSVPAGEIQVTEVWKFLGDPGRFR